MNPRKMYGVMMTAALLTAATAAAQSQEPRPATMPSANAADRTVTVVGCLQRDAAPGASAASGASAAAMYKLTNASPGTAAAGGATTSPSAGAGGRETPSTAGSTAGRAGSDAAAAHSDAGATATTEYRIVPGSGVGDLAPHVNHRMQFTGTVSPGAGRGAEGRGRESGDATSGRSAGNTEPSTPSAQGRGRAGSVANTPMLNVSSMTMVSSSCQ